MRAYSLLEIAISLAIIGVLSTAVIKGQQLLYSARIDKTITQIEAIKIAIETFNTTYSALPGDYGMDALNTNNKGNGDGIISGNEVNYFWEHLELAGFINKKQSVPAIGGKFTVKYNPGNLSGHWIFLSGPNETGILTSKDAISIKMKIDGNTDNNAGSVRVAGCVDGSNGIRATGQKACTIYIEFP